MSPKVRTAIIVIVAVLLVAAAYLFGRQGKLSTKEVPTQTPSPTLSAEASLSPSSTSKATKSPSPKPTPTKSPTPTPTPKTLTINSSAGLDGWRASNNGGNSTWYIQAGRNDTLTERGYVSFDLSSLPAGANLDQVSLRLYQTEVVGTPYASNSLIVDHVDYGTSLGSEDYALSPIESAFGTLTANAVVEWKDLIVTNQVKNDITAARTRSQFRLRFLTELTGPDAWARFESGDNYVGTGNTPQLFIKYH